MNTTQLKQLALSVTGAGKYKTLRGKVANAKRRWHHDRTRFGTGPDLRDWRLRDERNEAAELIYKERLRSGLQKKARKERGFISKKCAERGLPEEVAAMLAKFHGHRPFGSPWNRIEVGQPLSASTNREANSYGHGHEYWQGYLYHDCHTLTGKHGRKLFYLAGSFARSADAHPLVKFAKLAKKWGDWFYLLSQNKRRMAFYIEGGKLAAVKVPKGYRFAKDSLGLKVVAEKSGESWHFSPQEAQEGGEKLAAFLKGKEKRLVLEQKERETRWAEEERARQAEWENERQAARALRQAETQQREAIQRDIGTTMVTLADSRRAGNCVEGTLKFAETKLEIPRDEFKRCGFLLAVPAGRILRLANGQTREAERAIRAAWERETLVSI